MTNLLIRVALPSEDEILLQHYRALWESYGVDQTAIRVDADDITRDFIRNGRAHNEMAAYFAELDGEVVGSIACQVETLPYPDVTTPEFRKFGYIWSVYVEPRARRQGFASALLRVGIDYLRAIGCTKAVLHSSDAGERVYLEAGFKIAKEMRLNL